MHNKTLPPPSLTYEEIWDFKLEVDRITEERNRLVNNIQALRRTEKLEEEDETRLGQLRDEYRNINNRLRQILLIFKEERGVLGTHLKEIRYVERKYPGYRGRDNSEGLRPRQQSEEIRDNNDMVRGVIGALKRYFRDDVDYQGRAGISQPRPFSDSSDDDEILVPRQTSSDSSDSSDSSYSSDDDEILVPGQTSSDSSDSSYSSDDDEILVPQQQPAPQPRPVAQQPVVDLPADDPLLTPRAVWSFREEVYLIQEERRGIIQGDTPEHGRRQERFIQILSTARQRLNVIRENLVVAQGREREARENAATLQERLPRQLQEINNRMQQLNAEGGEIMNAWGQYEEENRDLINQLNAGLPSQEERQLETVPQGNRERIEEVRQQLNSFRQQVSQIRRQRTQFEQQRTQLEQQRNQARSEERETENQVLAIGAMCYNMEQLIEEVERYLAHEAPIMQQGN
jgi:chromosome segregation ATPase